MSYSSIAAMSTSTSLQARVAACASTQTDIPNGLPAAAWAVGNMLAICAQADWADAWDKAPLYNPDGTKTDVGARSDVITDAMILKGVRAVIGAQTLPADASGDTTNGAAAAS